MNTGSEAWRRKTVGGGTSQKRKKSFVVTHRTRCYTKENANCYQREQNVIESNAADNEDSQKTCANEEQKKTNLRRFNLLESQQAVHC